MHTHCFVTYRRRQTVCPKCKADWPREPAEKPLLPVGEAAVRPGEDGKRRARMRDDEDSDEDDMMDDDDTAGTPVQPRSQRNKKAGKGKAPANQSMDVDDDDEQEERESPAQSSQPKRRSSRK